MTPLFWIALAALPGIVLGVLVARSAPRKISAYKLPEPTPELPEPGETWGYQSSMLKRQGSPWEESVIRKPTVATIRVVQDGWVRYYFGKGDDPEDDLVRPLQEFLRMYRQWPIS